MFFASSEHKNATLSATAFGSTNFPEGYSDAIISLSFLGNPAVSLVSIVPGETALQVIPNFPYSAATHFENPAGFDNPNHFSSALDLSKLTEEALKNYQLARIFATKDTSILSLDKK